MVSKIIIQYEKVSNKICEFCAKKTVSYFVVLLYKMLLDILYCIEISGTYNFFYLQYSGINIINGWLATIIFAAIVQVYYEQKTCSAAMMIVLNLIYFIPITTYCGFGGGSSSFLLFTIIYWGILSLLQCHIPIYVYDKETTSITNKLFYLIVIVVSVITIYMWGKYSNFRIMTNIIDVYEVRAEADKYNVPLILSYFKQMSTIIISMLTLLAIYKRKYGIFVVLMFVTLINFSYAGLKSVILFPIILIGGYIFYRRNMIYVIVPLGVIMEIFAFVENRFGYSFITSYLFRREGVLLGMLSEDYYRFFLDNPTDIFRSSVLGKFGLDSIYNQSIGTVIGNNFQTQVVYCNNGLLADVWCNLGIIGLIIMPIILVICFRLFDFTTYKINSRLTIGFVLFFAITFANSTWSTVLLTHGFIIMCILMLLFPRETDNKD